MTTWAFNVGDGDTILVTADKLSDAARAVESEWDGMINGSMREGCARYVLHWRLDSIDPVAEARLFQADIKARTIAGGKL